MDVHFPTTSKCTDNSRFFWMSSLGDWMVLERFGAILLSVSHQRENPSISFWTMMKDLKSTRSSEMDPVRKAPHHVSTMGDQNYWAKEYYNSQRAQENTELCPYCFSLGDKYGRRHLKGGVVEWHSAEMNLRNTVRDSLGNLESIEDGRLSSILAYVGGSQVIGNRTHTLNVSVTHITWY